MNYFYNGPFYANWSTIYLRELFFGESQDHFNRSLRRNRPQGIDFNYLALDTQVLGSVLRGAYHEPLSQLAYDNIWQPLGMNHDAHWLHGEDGATFAQAMLMPTLGDFALFGQLYVQSGVWKGHQLLPTAWLRMAGHPNAPFQEPRPDREGYGMQFWVAYGPGGEFYANGLNGNYDWIDTKRKVVVAQFGAANDRDEVPAGERNAAFRAIAARAAQLTSREPPLVY